MSLVVLQLAKTSTENPRDSPKDNQNLKAFKAFSLKIVPTGG